MQAGELDFARRVCHGFGLPGDDPRLAPMPGSANRLWSLSTSGQRFVVKEFPYDGQPEQPDRRRRRAETAEFEHGLWAAGQLAMPEPVRDLDGQLIPAMLGSRGSRLALRVHGYLAGAAIMIPPSPATAEAAGAALAAIQQRGRAKRTTPSGSLREWAADPEAVLGRLAAAGTLSQDQAGTARAALREAATVIAAGEELPGPWVFTHCDHKPENSLLAGGRLAVLDWDEAGPCHPRLEAVESALRWAGVLVGQPRPGVFRAFLRAYARQAGPVAPLSRTDFAKWVAALPGWFADTAAEMSAAGLMAAAAIAALRDTLASLDRWAAWPVAA